jgi:hypothetical protein
MTRLDFVTKPSFNCPDDEAGDMAFIKATRTIGCRDTMEEYMACGLFTLSASFNLGEIADGEIPVLKLAIPLLEFPVAKRLEEMNDGFWVRVDLLTMIFVGQYALREHKVCVETVLNRGQVNQVFEQAGMS